jgi:hypothetical protein
VGVGVGVVGDAKIDSFVPYMGSLDLFTPPAGSITPKGVGFL